MLRVLHVLTSDDAPRAGAGRVKNPNGREAGREKMSSEVKVVNVVPSGPVVKRGDRFLAPIVLVLEDGRSIDSTLITSRLRRDAEPLRTRFIATFATRNLRALFSADGSFFGTQHIL